MLLFYFRFFQKRFKYVSKIVIVADNWYNYEDKIFQRPDPPQVQISSKNFELFFLSFNYIFKNKWS